MRLRFSKAKDPLQGWIQGVLGEGSPNPLYSHGSYGAPKVPQQFSTVNEGEEAEKEKEEEE